jgi:Ser/Thr protein kinase RdoA (MazF antagonist)
VTADMKADMKAALRREMAGVATGFEAIAGVVGPRHVYRVVAGDVNAIVKILLDGSIAPGVDALRWIARCLPDGSTLLVPEIVLADDQCGLLVTTELPGAPLAAVLASSAGEHVLARVGRALAELHACPAGPLRPTTLRDHVAELIDPHPAVLADELPEWSDVIHSAFASLASAGPCRPARVAPIHRDFHVRQIIVGERIGVVDWDLAAAGDPLFDVAYLTTYLETHGLDADGRLRSAFLASYASSTGEPVDGERLAVYRLFNLLRRAGRRHRLRDGRSDEWPVERDRMLMAVAADMEATA